MHTLPLRGERKPVTVLKNSVGGAAQAQVSPNGKWIAYQSTESGKSEVYVQSFSARGQTAGGKWQISIKGGQQPRWRRDGKELFYISGERVLMVVDTQADSSAFQAGIPKPLFEIRMGSAVRRNDYLAAANGQHFLVVMPLEQSTSSRITVVVNWMAGLKR
jgi:Tol biopolymer transport system component